MNGETKMKRVCIVTEEFAGLNKSGGIGACARGLAAHLSSEGWAVEVLLTDLDFRGGLARRDVFGDFTDLVFTSLYDAVERDAVVHLPVDDISKSYCVFRYLSDNRFDVIHFNDWAGSGFYTAMARRQGLIESRVITHLHGSSEWVRRFNLSIPSLADYEREAIERSQIENSDEVISPSNYLLTWCNDNGIKLPRARVINWLLPQWLDRGLATSNVRLSSKSLPAGVLKEIIFFGRHEKRKGFEIFVEAIARLPADFQPSITFIGRFDRIDREYTGSLALRRLKNYGGSIRFISDFNQEQAFLLLTRSKASLCIMPSLIENSPCVVGECLSAQIPFIATDVGGISELLHSESAKECLVPPNPDALANAIVRVSTDGLKEIRSNLIPAAIFRQWKAAHEDFYASKVSSGSFNEIHEPLVSVCVTHYNRPLLLNRALTAIIGQTYKNIEIVIVDDGSTSQAALKNLDDIESKESRFPIKVIRSENKYLGAARNLAASHSSGEFILFHDDDNVAQPEEVEVFVNAARNSDCDILTAQAYVFYPSDERDIEKPLRILYYPIGIGGVFSFFRNRFGDANAFIRRRSFELLGGFSELRGVGWEDWELFLKAYLSGMRMGVVPKPLFNYRATDDGMLNTGSVLRNSERLFDLIDRRRPSMGSDIFRLAQRDNLSQQVFDLTFNKLKREPFSHIHQDLMLQDPNSKEAKGRLSDLAFSLGRILDALDLGLHDYDQRSKLQGIISATNYRQGRVSWQEVIKRVEATAVGDWLYVQGWAAYPDGNPVHIDCFSIGGKRYDAVYCSRYPRSDVSVHMSLPVDNGVGFDLFGKQVPSRFALGRQYFRRRLVIPAAKNMALPGVTIKVRSPRAAGHVDRTVLCRQVEIAEILDDDIIALDVETSENGISVMVCGDLVDFGEAVSERRRRYIKGFGNRMKGQAPIIIVPCSVAADLIAIRAF
jgi:glycosyltransferase involved in cell wall biosynthesis